MMTKDDKSRQVQELSIEQQNAIDILIQGASDREAAELCGVARQTVNTWRNQNTAFIAALNQRRLDVWNSQTDKLRALVSAAVDVLKADLASEDARLRQAAAVRCLRVACTTTSTP